MNPLNYGKLIFKIDNIFIKQITSFTIALIFQFDKFNEVKLFREGELIFIYKDHKIDESTFIRSIENKKYTFKNNELIAIQKPTNLLIIIIIYHNLNSTTILIIIYK
jgi:hypothetical protein